MTIQKDPENKTNQGNEEKGKAQGLLSLVAYGKPDWYAYEIMFPHQLAVYLDAASAFDKNPTEENRIKMEDTKKKYLEFKKDLRWRMGLDDKKENEVDISFTDKGDYVIHDPNFPREPFGLRMANRAFNWMCSLFYSY